MHDTAGQLAEDAPAVLAHPEAARGLEQALIEAMIDCLNNGEVNEDRAALRQHTTIMRRFYRVIEQHGDEPLYISQLCKEIGTPPFFERVLPGAFGHGPQEVSTASGMNMVRRALQRAALSETTVTETATRYGFWQFGRLAVAYKALFGASPSATLARPV